MATTSLNLDELQREMLGFLPPVDLSSLCCCCIIDPSLAPNEHLVDCEIQSLQPVSDILSDTCSSSACGSPTEDHCMEKRRKHRESMARLRRGWRTSIAALQQQEKELQALLARMIASPPQTNSCLTDASTKPLDVLRRSYRELVEEQVRLEQEQASLEAARAHKEKYDRLLERELVRLRMFHVSDEA